ncbi:paraquat-inducible protein A [Shewanella profunda]|uniref:paraquat-inducible protein A n=1 Tax=Shewanella profunda TaxID=254793 RepID=UPI00200D696D|nr:paraquat-inducible protein A [Shewanella profunda]MCL1089108.1 paraquat-inducible protein A [Shewanella profunda]
MSGLQAIRTGTATCLTCGMLGSPIPKPVCKRCGSSLHFRKPNNIQRTWAYLIAAYVLYLPANLLPITITRSIFGTQHDTIMSGVVYLWHSGSWAISLIVFIASVVVPLLKLFSLTLLVISVQRRWCGEVMRRAKLYRILEAIGRWSMLDVYVVTILVALVRAESLATISPGSGVLAFAAVVILSMLAAMAFDPRLIWDPLDETQPKENVK